MSKKLGNLKDARMIYFAHINRDIPEGWEEFGEQNGTYRHCYRSLDNLIYKICRRYNKPHIDNENDEELDKLAQIKSKKVVYKGWRVYNVNGFKFFSGGYKITVNVSELIEGSHEDISEDDYDGMEPVETAFNAFDIYDCHIGNYILTPGGERVIVDLSC